MRFLLVGTLLLLSMVGCQSKPQRTTAASPPASDPDYLKNKEAEALSLSGDNKGAVFSNDGEKLFLLSKNRLGHKNYQVYEWDLFTKSTRRLTFQDGDVMGVIPYGQIEILYNSSTDEIKENPFEREKDHRYPRSEIYKSDFYGSEIERLTTSPEYDGQMVVVPARKELLFVSTRAGNPGLYWYHLETKDQKPFQVDREKENKLPALATDGKSVYWVLSDSKTGQDSLMSSKVFGKEVQTLKTLEGQVQHLSTTGNGALVYSWKPKGSTFAQIDMFDSAKNCTQTLLKGTANFLEPQFSPKNQNLMIFRVQTLEQNQIYRWELPANLGPCAETPTSDTLTQ